MFFYTFKGALNRTTIRLYSMANIERAVKAVLAKRGLEYSLNKKTRHYFFFFNNLTINKIEGQDNGTEVPN